LTSGASPRFFEPEVTMVHGVLCNDNNPDLRFTTAFASAVASARAGVPLHASRDDAAREWPP
jgi:hypothetical protein